VTGLPKRGALSQKGRGKFPASLLRSLALTLALAGVASSAFAEPTLSVAVFGAAAGPRASAAEETRLIAIDQFGYRPGDRKFAVLADPVEGFNRDATYSPSKVLEVRRWKDDTIVFSGQSAAWNAGELQASSGDRGWWFDFSELASEGTYYILDEANNLRSGAFRIGDDVYNAVLNASLRAFFYNRAGFAKKVPFADVRWQDDAAYLGPRQDGEARSAFMPDDASLQRDLRGGWFDAGDTNKYTNSAAYSLHMLLGAYREKPEVWSDTVGIPESGNGIPDILDEIQWELDWLERMQEDDGSVILKVGKITHNGFSPPSLDSEPRYHTGVCSSSTITAASVFAHAALVWRSLQALADRSEILLRHAIDAWRWYQANPKRDDCDNQIVKAGDADLSLETQKSWSVVAAAYLYAATGEAEFGDYFKVNFKETLPFREEGWSRYHSPEGDALLFYAASDTANDEARNEILSRKIDNALGSSELYGGDIASDLYRSFLTDSSYHWGSNRVRLEQGHTNYLMVEFGLSDGNSLREFEERALSAIHYIHGVNPLGIVYLSNMYELGAEHSVNEIYHSWFADGTDFDNALSSKFGPAPGFLVGGPNKDYSGQIAPPAAQPIQKAYRDWNAGWPERSWELTEPSITYQAAYVRLLSKFASTDH